MLELCGPAGEPVDFARTLVSHGVASLPPMRVDRAAQLFEITLALPSTRPRLVRVAACEPQACRVEVFGRALTRRADDALADKIRHILSLDQDLSSFYAVARADPELSWAAAGAGRMVRSATVFEEVVKTICTTNCAWSATVRMTSALVEHLGERAEGAPDDGPIGKTFPTAEAMAGAGERFYRDVARAGYRGRYLIDLASQVADGTIDLEELGRTPPDELPDPEMARRLQMLPGVGPYAAAHIMMMLGRHSLLVLDSWTRPTYARLTGKRSVSDESIRRRFRRYGRYAGLAFWLFLTRDWLSEAQSGQPAR